MRTIFKSMYSQSTSILVVYIIWFHYKVEYTCPSIGKTDPYTFNLTSIFENKQVNMFSYNSIMYIFYCKSACNVLVINYKWDSFLFSLQSTAMAIRPIITEFTTKIFLSKRKRVESDCFSENLFMCFILNFKQYLLSVICLI